MTNLNPFMATDGYKTSHLPMYPSGTITVSSNFTPRSGNHSNVSDKSGIISFGQQMVMRQIVEMFDKDFFGRDRNAVLEEIKSEYSMYLGFDYDVSHIGDLHKLGYLPIHVKTLPEGSFVPYGVPVLTIVNTNHKFFWLTNFLETLISTMMWMPMTSATTAYEYKKILLRNAKVTDESNIGGVDFQGHNFSMRGMAGVDAAIYAGLGHATSFLGDDSLPTIVAARRYYDETGAVVHSVPATEHSVMCAGSKDDELGTFRNLMKTFPTGILSIVSDTWDLWNVCTEMLPKLKEEILAREGKIVIRPDSGDPVDIICGLQTPMSEYGLRDAKYKGVIELLWDVFGGTTNEQGFKVLDPHIGCIYGDSITPIRATQICERLKAKGFATTNIVLGIGSYTYQMVTRDTHGFAMKATYIEILNKNCDTSECELNCKKECWNDGCLLDNGIVEGREIFKDPVTDDGTKKSAKGMLSVHRSVIKGEPIYLKDQCTWKEEGEGLLQTIFKNGDFFNETTLSEIRTRINNI